MVGGLAALCFAFGWQMRRIAARGREAELRRSLFEAKGAVPQLESAVRNREQRASTLELQVKALNDQLSALNASARQKDTEIVKRDREIRTLNSELTIVKDGSSSGEVLLDGLDPPVEPNAADPKMARRHAALEARYEAMKRGLVQRDDRIAELEETLNNPGNETPTRTLEHQLSELEHSSNALKDALEERETQLELLQTRLQEEVAQREALENLAKRRGEGNRELKAAAAQYKQQLPELMKSIESRNGQIAERDGKLLSLTRELKGERQLCETREAELKALQEQLAAQQARQRELQQSLREHDEARRVLQDELTNTRDALRTTESVVREREAAIADAEQRVAEANGRTETRERTVAALQNTIRDRDFKIAGLETAANQQSAKLEMLRSTFFEAKTEHRTRITSLEEQLADAKAQHQAGIERTAEIESRLAAAELRNQSLEDTGAARELALADLELAADQLRHDVADLAQSLAGSRSALARRQSAILWLVARLVPSTPLLPPPAAEESSAIDTNVAAAGNDGTRAPAPTAVTTDEPDAVGF